MSCSGSFRTGGPGIFAVLGIPAAARRGAVIGCLSQVVADGIHRRRRGPLVCRLEPRPRVLFPRRNEKQAKLGQKVSVRCRDSIGVRGAFDVSARYQRMTEPQGSIRIPGGQLALAGGRCIRPVGGLGDAC